MSPATPFGSPRVRGSVPTTLVELVKTGTNRKSFVLSYLQEIIGDFPGGHPAGIDPHRDLNSLGIDATGSERLVAKIESDLEISLHHHHIQSRFTLEQLASVVLAELGTRLDGGTPENGIIAECPLSYGQRALWFLQQLDPNSVAYNVSYAARFPTKVDCGAAERAFQGIVDRHSCLRSTFREINREPVRLVHAHARASFAVEDGSTWTPRKWRDRLDEEMFRIFDLTTGPLMRVFMLSKSEDDHVVMLNMHHIITDMWSYAIIMSEFSRFYQSALTGEDPHLPPLRVDYADHVRTEREMLAGPEGESHWDYWREHLRDLPRSLDLPTDYARQSIMTTRGASSLLCLDSSLTEQLKSQAHAEKCTLFTLLLGAFQTLLYHYTGEERILVGSPKACRSGRTGHMVGYFVNPIVLLGDLSGNPPWKTFLHRLNDTVSASFLHDAFPFPLIVERLQPERELARTPLFQVLFSWQKTISLVDRKNMGSFALGKEGERTQVAGFPMEPFSLPSRVVPFDLSLLVGESADGITVTLEYNTDLFVSSTTEKMLERYRNILIAVAANPDQRIDSLPLLTDSEELHLAEWNRMEGAMDGEGCVWQMFEEQAARSPGSVAVVLGNEAVTYAGVNRRANQIARFLRARGVTSETVVALMLPRSPETIIAMLGILKAGGVYLPIDPECPPERLAYMLGEAAPKFLVTSSSLLSKRKIPPTEALCLDTAEAHIVRESVDNPGWETDALHAAYIIYTSGSTGLPKGVVIPHRALALHCRAMQKHYHTRPTDVVLQFASLEFDASLEQILVPLITGAKVLLRDPELWTPQMLFRQLRASHITVINVPPAYWNQVVQWWSANPDLPAPDSLRLVIVGGDVLSPESVLLWSKSPARAARFLNAYGPTETTITAATHEIVADADGGERALRIPIGRSPGARTIHILNRSLHPVPPGLPGELYIGGETLARGYLRLPDRTAESFLPDPFSGVPGARLYKTGDLGRFRADGSVEYLGRTDFQIKIRGFRVETGEIESALLRHPAVAQAVVVSREDSIGERRLVAYLVVRPGEEIDEDEVRRFLQRSLPSYMLPTACVMLERIPLSAGGKIDRGALPIPQWEERRCRQEYVAPRSQVEEELAEILARVLGVSRVGIYDNFFDLGGHSLLATQYIAVVRDRFHVEVPIRSVFEAPTVADFAAVLLEFLAAGEEESQIAEMLKEVERMSDEGVRKLLQKERSNLST
ncbi:MAG: amino acid adenylation domain-containing protein [Bacteroidota bacterium]